MSLDAIQSIDEAEKAAAKRKADAAAEARKKLALAEAENQAAMDAAVKKAAAEVKDLIHKADEKATAAAMELATNTENKKAAMRVKAGSRMEAAASLIVERIVSG